MAAQDEKTIKHYWLYTLRLEKGKYYVGITSRKNPNDRINEHMNGFYSAQWVKKYKPIEPIEVIDMGNITKEEAERLELERTLQYMEKFGHQNVRGGRLNYSGKYIKIGDRFFADEDFKMLIGVIIMMAAMVALVLKAY